MTHDLLDRLHLTPGSVARLIGAPEALAESLRRAAGDSVTWVDDGPCSWLMAFAADQAALADLVPRAVPLLGEEAVFWVAHPRAGTKTDLTHHAGWRPLVAEGFEETEALSLDDHWRASRFSHLHETHLRAGGVSRP